MTPGSTVTTRSGKIGKVVAEDRETITLTITCHLTDVAQTPHRYGRKPVDRRPIEVVARYHRDDLTIVS